MPQWRRVLFAVGGVVTFALVFLVAFLFMVVGRASSRIDVLNSAGLSRDRAVAALASGDSQLRSQVKALGGTPNVPPPQVIISGVAGAQGIQGPGPSDSQVASAVAAYLAAHPVPGVSTSQVAAAVSAYLAASPPPSGPQGPGPSDQQVANAVASYLQANPPPSGPPGVNGKDGANGSPPAGWVFEAGGVTYDCVPDGGSPAPHYTCPPRSPSASPSQSPSPSASSSPSATAGPIPSATDSPTPTPTAAGPTASLSLAFLQPLDPATPRPGQPGGPRSGLLLLAPSYLPLSRRTA